jgi:hypothetical protein
MSRRLFLVRGLDRFMGPVGEYFWADTAEAARAAFFAKFGLRASSVEVEHES